MSNKNNSFYKNKKLRVFLIIIAVLLFGFILPETTIIPVKDATARDWNHATFWNEPWGQSGVHKGIDIFAENGQAVISSSYGLRVYKGNLGIGGNVVVILGPKWRLHYYAQLKHTAKSNSIWVRTGDQIGAVGNTGNAVGKPPHLHYSILSLLPYPCRWDHDTQGWKKMFFLNPSEILMSN